VSSGCHNTIDITTLFLILVLDIITMVWVFYEESLKILSKLQRWTDLVSLLLWSTVLNEKQLENISTNQKPGENSLCRGLNEG